MTYGRHGYCLLNSQSQESVRSFSLLLRSLKIVVIDAVAESKFDNQLGPHVRRYAYSYLLFDKCAYKLLSQGSSTIEKVVVWCLMPLLRRVVYRGLGCHKPGRKEHSLQIVESVFKEVRFGFCK